MTIAANGVDLFLPETYDIVWSLIILIIVALFFYKFFLPKFQSVFDERTAKIEGGLAKAEQAQKDAEEAKKKYQAQLSTARVEASKIRDDARAEASPYHRGRPFACRDRGRADYRECRTLAGIPAAEGHGESEG